MEWLWEWERQMSLFILRGIIYCWIQIYPREFIAQTRIFAHSKNNTAELYFNKEDLMNNSERLVERIKEDGKTLDKMKEYIAANCEYLDRYCDEKLEGKDLSILSDKELVELHDEFYESYHRAPLGICLVRTYDKVGPKQLREFLESKITDKNKIVHYMNILTSTTKEGMMLREERDFLTIAIEIMQDEKARELFAKGLDEINSNLHQFPEINDMLNEHIEKYHWIPCGYNDEPAWDRDYFLQILKGLVLEERKHEERLKIIEEYPDKLQMEKENIIAELNPDAGMRNLIDALSEGSFFKDYIRESLNRAHHKSRPLFEEIGKRISANLTEVKTLTPEETKNALLFKKLDKRLIKDRRDYCVVYGDEKGIDIFTGDDARKFEEKTLKQVLDHKIEELKGMCGSPGHAEGIVKIVKKHEHLSEIDKDFVLVTPMTTPELVVAVKRAVAIVTDEGGTACHAAIIAREFGIPCVVGTRMATKVLKDGDVVEVDASAGIVRKVG